jgi:hypothetical protein
MMIIVFNKDEILLWEHYVGQCPLSEVYLIYTAFRELTTPVFR